jgi:hypothetical protein
MKQMHTPTPTCAAHRRTAVCAGAQRAAAAAALEAQATLPGSSTSCGQARSTTTRGRRRRSSRELPVRAVDMVPGGAADVRPQRHAAEGMQPVNEGMNEVTGRPEH